MKMYLENFREGNNVEELWTDERIILKQET
jgi:hypothetical protein